MACAGAHKPRSTPASEDSEDTLWKVSLVLSDAYLNIGDLIGITCNNTASVFWGIRQIDGPNGRYLMVSNSSHGLGRIGVNRGGAQHTL